MDSTSSPSQVINTRSRSRLSSSDLPNSSENGIRSTTVSRPVEFETISSSRNSTTSTSTSTTSSTTINPSINSSLDTSSTAAVAAFLNQSNDLYSTNSSTTAMLRKISSNSVNYIRSCDIVVSKFFQILTSNPNISFLANQVQDPEVEDGRLEFTLILLTRGVKTQAKYDILNLALLFWATNLKKKNHEHVDLTQR